MEIFSAVTDAMDESAAKGWEKQIEEADKNKTLQAENKAQAAVIEQAKEALKALWHEHKMSLEKAHELLKERGFETDSPERMLSVADHMTGTQAALDAIEALEKEDGK